jgi:GNAT superfamily N-acetyltransferase
MITISTDRHLLDVSYIHVFLSQTYWAQGRTREEVESAIRHSLNFGLYLDGRQIGYARVVTDYTGFAYLMDLFTDPEHRGLGYSKRLMEHILGFPDLQTIRVWRLATTDAHGLYEQFGFRPLATPEKMMELLRPIRQ